MDKRCREDIALLESMPGLTPATAYGRLTAQLADTIRRNKADKLFRETVLPILEEEKPYAGSVFLSVVMRTQGRRPAALLDALNSLRAQTDQDFEILLIGHRLTPAEKVVVTPTLNQLDPDFRGKVRYMPLNRGGRSAPLNFAFAHARGRYIAPLDDDDLVTVNWIEEFRKASVTAPGTILHAYGLAQYWLVEETENGQQLKPVGDYIRIYCQDFNAIYQLYINNCPFICIAFPREIFADWGFIFDESLNITEDWDYLMRTSVIFGITDIRTPTSIYRRWTNAENSSTVHEQIEWDDNRAAIQKKFTSGMSIIDTHGMSELVRMLNTGVFALDESGLLISTADRQLHEIQTSNSWRLGRGITRIPGKITSLLHVIRKSGLREGFSWLRQHLTDDVFQ